MLTFLRPKTYTASPKDLLYCMGLIPPSDIFIRERQSSRVLTTSSRWLKIAPYAIDREG